MSTTACPILTDGDLAYIGGLFDGEGSAGVYPHCGHKNKRLSDGSYEKGWMRSNIVLTMTDPEPVYFYALCFGGGNIYKRKLKSGKIAYQWGVSDRTANAVAQKLLPHVKCERRVAQLQAVIDYKSRKGLNVKPGVKGFIRGGRAGGGEGVIGSPS